MSKNLFNIEQEYFTTLEQIEEVEGVLTPELEEALKVNEEELHAKLQAYIYYIKQLDGDIATINGEVERLNGRIKSLENTKTRLKESVKDALLLFGETGKSGNRTMKVGTHTIYNTYTKPVKLEVEDKEFTELYKTTNFVNKKEVFSVNKTAIKEHLLSQEGYIKLISDSLPELNHDEVIDYNNQLYDDYIHSGLTLEEFYNLSEDPINFKPNPLQYVLTDAYIDYEQNHITIR